MIGARDVDGMNIDVLPLAGYAVVNRLRRPNRWKCGNRFLRIGAKGRVEVLPGGEFGIEVSHEKPGRRKAGHDRQCPLRGIVSCYTVRARQVRGADPYWPLGRLNASQHERTRL